MLDPFATLGVPARFEVDLPALEQRHRDLSKTLHPDRYAQASAVERRMALGRAIEVNEAFRTLKDPITRAQAILRHAGVEVSETNQPKPPASLLMEIMETREELADAHRRKDLARVEKLGDAMRARQDAVLVVLGKGFDAAGGEPAKLEALLPSIGELRYLRRFLDEVGAIEEELTA